MYLYRQQPEDVLEVETRELVISNVSTLPLTTALSLKQPFQILLHDGQEVSETVSPSRLIQNFSLNGICFML